MYNVLCICTHNNRVMLHCENVAVHARSRAEAKHFAIDDRDVSDDDDILLRARACGPASRCILYVYRMHMKGLAEGRCGKAAGKKWSSRNCIIYARKPCVCRRSLSLSLLKWCACLAVCLCARVVAGGNFFGGIRGRFSSECFSMFWKTRV